MPVESLVGGCTLLPVVRSSTVCLPTLFDSSHSSGEDRSGRSRRGSGGPLLASETMVPEVVVSSGGTSQNSHSSEGPCLPTYVSSAPSKAGESSSLSLAAFREKVKQSGLSARATEFSAEALRESTRASYDSKLECFFKWCNDIPCDPSTASLGQIADFLVYLFDKGLAISTIRSYRSALASCHKGFQDGSSISGSSVLTRLCRSFFLKRPPVKTLLPAWFFGLFQKRRLNFFTRLLFIVWPLRRRFLWPSPRVTESVRFMPSLLSWVIFAGNLMVFVLCLDQTSLPRISLCFFSRLRFSCFLFRPSLPLKQTKCGVQSEP